MGLARPLALMLVVATVGCFEEDDLGPVRAEVVEWRMDSVLQVNATYRIMNIGNDTIWNRRFLPNPLLSTKCLESVSATTRTPSGIALSYPHLFMPGEALPRGYQVDRSMWLDFAYDAEISGFDASRASHFTPKLLASFETDGIAWDGSITPCRISVTGETLPSENPDYPCPHYIVSPVHKAWKPWYGLREIGEPIENGTSEGGEGDR